MFAHDFRHWNETHFKIIAKKTVMSIRNCLHWHGAVNTIDTGIDPDEAFYVLLYRLLKDLDKSLMFQKSSAFRSTADDRAIATQESSVDIYTGWGTEGARVPKSVTKPADVSKNFHRTWGIMEILSSLFVDCIRCLRMHAIWVELNRITMTSSWVSCRMFFWKTEHWFSSRIMS